MKFFYLPIFSGIILLSCSNNPTFADKPVNEEFLTNFKEVSYRLAKNFYVKSDYNFHHIKKPYIDNEVQFDKIFGIEDQLNGKIVDFDNEIVIPIILDKTSIATKITIDEIQIKGNDIIINYTVNQLHQLSYLIQPSEIIIIDKSIIHDLNKLKLKFNKTTNLL